MSCGRETKSRVMKPVVINIFSDIHHSPTNRRESKIRSGWLLKDVNFLSPTFRAIHKLVYNGQVGFFGGCPKR